MFGARDEGVGVLYYMKFDHLGFPRCKGVWAADSVSSDYETWSPSDGVSTENCMLGQQVTYTRRKPLRNVGTVKTSGVSSRRNFVHALRKIMHAKSVSREMWARQSASTAARTSSLSEICPQCALVASRPILIERSPAMCAMADGRR